jgi:hypothetical protein
MRQTSLADGGVPVKGVHAVVSEAPLHVYMKMSELLP